MSSAQKLERRLPMPTAIVAGGAGFLGSHLCEKLLDNQVEVVCVDNFSTGKKSHLFRCLKSPHFHLLTLDAHGLSANRILRAHYIFDIIDTQDRQPSNNDLDTLLDGTTITKRLLEVAQKFSAKFLLASTSSAASIEESIATEYHRNHNLDTRIVRLTDVYGPRMDISAQLPLPRLINQIHHHQQLEIEGKGSRQLSPVYVDDAVEGIMKAMFSPGTTGEIFTLSSQTVSQLDVARMLQKLSPFHPQINSIPTNAVFTSPPPPQPRIPWKPTVSLETGLRFTLDSLDQAPTRLQPFRPVHPKPHPFSPPPIEIHEPPTYIKILWDEEKPITFYGGQRRYLRLITDANESYHDVTDPSRSRVNVIISGGNSVQLKGSTPLRGGRMRLILQGISTEVGEKSKVRVELQRVNMPSLFD